MNRIFNILKQHLPSTILVALVLATLIVLLPFQWSGGETRKEAKKAAPKTPPPVEAPAARPPPAPPPLPPAARALYDEITQILQANYVDPTVLNARKTGEGAVAGMLKSLGGSARIMESEPALEKPPIQKDVIHDVAVIDPFIGYLRLSRLENDTGKKLETEIAKLEKERHVTSLIIDLRFAQGDQYAAVAPVASVFLNSPRPLYNVRRGVAVENHEAIPPANPTVIPLVILVNAETRGAPEILAAVLHDQGRAVVIGDSETAGQAFETTDMKLSNGQILRLATSKIALARAGDFFLKKLRPDVSVVFDVKTERKIFDQPFRPPEIRSETRYYSEAILTGRDAAPLLTREKEKKDQPEPASNGDLVLLRAIDLLKSIQALGLTPETTATSNKG